MGGLLTTDSVLMCPHGGTVTVTTSNNRVFVNGAAVLRETDEFVIPDCPFPPPMSDEEEQEVIGFCHAVFASSHFF